jgi:hypothetical protein
VRDPAERISLKLELQAAGELETNEPLTVGELATDRGRHTPETPALSPEMRALFRKARLDPARTYSEGEVDQALADAALDVTSRIAVRTELALRRQVHAAWDLQAAAEPSRPRGKILMAAGRRPSIFSSINSGSGAAPSASPASGGAWPPGRPG